jgi:hypothetical protein
MPFSELIFIHICFSVRDNMDEEGGGIELKPLGDKRDDRRLNRPGKKE